MGFKLAVKSIVDKMFRGFTNLTIERNRPVVCRLKLYLSGLGMRIKVAFVNEGMKLPGCHMLLGIIELYEINVSETDGVFIYSSSVNVRTDERVFQFTNREFSVFWI